MVKVTGAFQKSTEIMKTTNQLIKLPQLSATMREMSMEMMKVSEALLPALLAAFAEHCSDVRSSQSGILEEMMEETLDTVDDDELEDEADAEVDKVLFELTDGKLGQAGRVGTELPVSNFRSARRPLANLRPTRRTRRTWRRCRRCSERCRICSVVRGERIYAGEPKSLTACQAV